jgi:isoleucyl-tRNA synthetase
MRVMPYSWALETPVSNFETRIDDAYRPRQDPALTVRSRSTPRPAIRARCRSWSGRRRRGRCRATSRSRSAPDIDYAIVEQDGRYVLARRSVLGKYAKELPTASEPKLVGTLTGKDLVGRTYEPLFPYFAKHRPTRSVLAGDFVDTEPTAPASCTWRRASARTTSASARRTASTLVCPVDDRGRFTSEVQWTTSGPARVRRQQADHQGAEDERGVVVATTYLHNYPHCWRTRSR